MFNFVNTIITFLQNFFEGLFFSSSPEYQKKKQLRSYAGEIRKLNPPLYRTDKTLLPAFAVLLYQLYHFLLPIKAILEKTVNSPDIRAAEKYQDIFFETLLSDEERQQRKIFTFQERQLGLADCSKYEEAEQRIQEQIHEFKNFIKIFQNPAFKTREQGLVNLFFLSDLCNFDYTAFLTHFNKNFQLSPTTENTVPQQEFEEVFAGDVIQNLLDLQFIIQNITIDAATIDQIVFLAVQSSDISEDSKQKLKKTLQTVDNILTNHLKRTSIPIMLKLIKDDPNFEEKITMAEIHPLQNYLDRFNDNFQADSKRLLKIHKENNITGLIEKCFGSTPLKSLEGYNETINDAIQSLSTISFDWVKPLQLLKAFTEMYFESRYKIFLQSLLVEGYFANKQLEIKYSSIYRSCEMLAGKIRNFEQLFKPKGQCSVQEIQNYIAEIEKGKDLKKQLHKIVEIANMQAKTIVQTGSKAYADLYSFTGHLLEDIKATAPEFVTNLRALSTSSKNREAFSHLEQDRSLFAQFLEIMKNYAVFGPIEQSRNAEVQTQTQEQGQKRQ